jgi:hypothetical protein
MPTVVAEIFPPRAASSRGQSYQISRRRPCSCPAATGLMTCHPDRRHRHPTSHPHRPNCDVGFHHCCRLGHHFGWAIGRRHRHPAPPPHAKPARPATSTRPLGHLRPHPAGRPPALQCWPPAPPPVLATRPPPPRMTHRSGRRRRHLAPPPGLASPGCHHVGRVRPQPARHYHLAAPFSWPTGLHAGTPARAPPLPRAGIANGRSCHLDIAASCCHRPGTGASCFPGRSSGGHHPHCRVILLGRWRLVCRPHYPHAAGIILKAGEETAAPTAPSSIKVCEICTYIFTTRYGLWIVVECI